MWTFRYDAGSASAYKWEWVGGSPLFSEITATESRASGTYGALATAGPSITVPLAGDFEVEVADDQYHSAPTGGADHWHSYSIGAVAAADADAASNSHSAANTPTTARRITRKTLASAGTSLVSQYRTDSTSVTAVFRNRTLRVRPIRVG